MSRARKTTSFLLWPAAIAAILAAMPHASAVELNRNAVPGILDLQIYESRERRRDFQDRQQLYRELDRQPAVRLRERPDVPTMVPTCQLRTFGSRLLSVCR